MTCYADMVTDCLRGHQKTASCHRMIVNYWQHAPAIERIARQEGVEPELLKALIAYESRYNHQAVSPAPNCFRDARSSIEPVYSGSLYPHRSTLPASNV